ncbi:sugar phosphate nucleotidyltransferase [Bacillus haimaensis]|uniref:sugar phosphate nucleotidyltransferase n=1 Tax=Bacillus haimaensis TaxID=3160967 RepID=UPI003AA852FE
MNLILLSGGSGKRLWPLSNESRSKQFLKVLQNEKREPQSMVQRVWEQLKSLDLHSSTVIATSKSQVETIQAQLNHEASLVIEPSRRDTFPAIALAVAYLYSVKKIDESSVVGVLPVDPYVESEFFSKIIELERVLEKTDADIGLVGVRPTLPSSKYGYIVPSVIGKQYLKVEKFIEKPNEHEAQNLVDIGALWNCGVFAFKLKYILSFLEDMGYPTEYNELLEVYTELPKISFDYEVVEKAKKIIVLPYSGYWKDLGTWNTLTEEMASFQIGKGIISDNSINSHLINELDIPITVLGTKNIIVAASADGILVSDKKSSPKIKDYISNFDNPPMYEERKWGWSKILDYTKNSEGKEVITKKICLKKNMNLSYQFHNKRTELWTVIKGKGIVALNGNFRNVYAGDVIQIDTGDNHALKALSELEIIEIQCGVEVIEEDVIRICNEWFEIEKECSKSIVKR